MKLETFLLGCSPLPWPHEAQKYRDGDIENCNDFYERHAANALPELVVAARQFQYAVLRNGQVGQEMILRLQNALAAAEEVKV